MMMIMMQLLVSHNIWHIAHRILCLPILYNRPIGVCWDLYIYIKKIFSGTGSNAMHKQLNDLNVFLFIIFFINDSYD